MHLAILAAVVSFFGPGTTAHCHRATQHSAICAYSTPAENVGIEADSPGWTWHAYCRVIWHQGRVRITTPGFS